MRPSVCRRFCIFFGHAQPHMSVQPLEVLNGFLDIGPGHFHMVRVLTLAALTTEGPLPPSHQIGHRPKLIRSEICGRFPICLQKEIPSYCRPDEGNKVKGQLNCCVCVTLTARVRQQPRPWHACGSDVFSCWDPGIHTLGAAPSLRSHLSPASQVLLSGDAVFASSLHNCGSHLWSGSSLGRLAAHSEHMTCAPSCLRTPQIGEAVR